MEGGIRIRKADLGVRSFLFILKSPHNFLFPSALKAEKNDQAIHCYPSAFPSRVQSHSSKFRLPARFHGKEAVDQTCNYWTAQIQQIFNFSLNLASLNESRQRDGFHNRHSPINPSLIDLTRNFFIPTNYRSFFKSAQIKHTVFETMKIGHKPSDSLAINGDSQFPQAPPPIEHRARIWIRKRDLRKIQIGVGGNKHNCRRNHNGNVTAATGLRLNALQS
jgi:hypothetical protein